MSRYLATRPTLADADDLFIDQCCEYFRAHQAVRGPSYASERTANLIEDRLTERQTGMRRPLMDFGIRDMRRWWDEVADSYHTTAVDIAAMMKSGSWSDARCAIAACLDAAANHPATEDDSGELGWVPDSTL